MKKFFLCLVALAAVATTVQAQAQAPRPKKNILGIRAGLSVSDIAIKADDMKLILGSNASFHAGVTDQIRLMPRNPFYLELGLLLHNKGGRESMYAQYDTDWGGGSMEGELKINLLYLELPFGLNYRFDVGKNFTLIPQAGFYCGVGTVVWTREKWDDGDSETTASIFGDTDFLPVDFGGRIGLGATWREHFYLGISYEGSFMNIMDNGDSSITTHNRTWMVTLGYNF